MNLNIVTISVLIELLLAPVVYGIFVKLAALLLRCQGLSWKDGFKFGLIMVVSNSLFALGLGHLPFFMNFLVGLVVNWLIGSWYLSSRNVRAKGGVIGWWSALLLTGITFVMMSTVFFLIFMLKVERGS